MSQTSEQVSISDHEKLRSSTYYLDLPTTDVEIARLKVQHELWLRILDGRLFTASPSLQNGSHLDVGCGSGVWTSHVARAHPDTSVTGIDLTPPTNTFELKNLQYIQADALKPWQFASSNGAPYDFITARVLVNSIGDWDLLTKNCYDHLKPGGWIEIHDIVLGIYSEKVDWNDESNALMKWFQCFRRGILIQGMDGFKSNTHGDTLRSQGFRNVNSEFFKWYMSEELASGDKEKAIARLLTTNGLSLIESVTKVMMAKGAWDLMKISQAELGELKDAAKQEIITNSTKYGYYWNMNVHVGQK